MNLASHFDYNFSLIHAHKWSFTEIENMLPWERDIYLYKLEEWVKEEKRRHEEEQQRQKHG